MAADATRLLGHVAGPRVAHAGRTERGHVAGGHACPRRSTWAPMGGATWQVRSTDGGPTGIVAPS